MACPQCGADVPPDDDFCGKCGYAIRESTPERLDQSRIRVHEKPDALPAAQAGSSEQRVRKPTMVGMPALTPAQRPPPSADQGRPKEDTGQARKRAQQKTMLGIPRPDLPPPIPVGGSESPGGATSLDEPGAAPPEPEEKSLSARPPRARARVRYDSANETFPMLQRRKNALRGLAVLIVLAGGWLAYRFLTLTG